MSDHKWQTDERHAEYRYGCWAGRPEGVAQDAERCVRAVPSTTARGMVSTQCARKRKHGLYCGVHKKFDTTKEGT